MNSRSNCRYSSDALRGRGQLKADGRPDAVAVVVIRRTLRASTGSANTADVLLLRRARGAFAGAWTVVMGLVDGEERATDAALRELREETGLRAAALYTAGELDAFYDPVRDRIVHVPFFVVYADAGAAVVLEDAVHDEHRWVPFDEACRMVEFAAQRRVLGEIERAFVHDEPRPWRLIRGTSAE